MTKLAAVFGVLVLTSAVVGKAQDRPNYAGAWTLVEGAGTTAGTRALGKEFKLTQTATAVTIETTATVYSSTATAGGGMGAPEPREIKFSTEYICDGQEHEQALPSLAAMITTQPPPGAMVSQAPPTIYRATWMTGQLIILKHSKLPSENNALLTVNRLALSLDADGSLVVDSLSLPMRPRANGPKQEPPVSVRSVYKKAQ